MLETLLDIVDGVNAFGKEYSGVLLVIIAYCAIRLMLCRPIAQSRFADTRWHSKTVGVNPSLRKRSSFDVNAFISGRNDLSAFGNLPKVNLTKSAGQIAEAQRYNDLRRIRKNPDAYSAYDKMRAGLMDGPYGIAPAKSAGLGGNI